MKHATEKKMAALESWLAPIFEKFPHLPQGGRDTLVQIAPWLSLIFGILGLLALVSTGALLSLFSFRIMMLGVSQIGMWVSVLAGAVAAALQIMAYKPLSATKKHGWNLLFYGMVLSAIASIVNIVLYYGYGFGSLIGLVIGFWLLFEIRTMYR